MVRTVSAPPSGIASMALSTRLRRARATCSGSAATVGSSGASSARAVTRAWANCASNSFMVSPASAFRFTGCISGAGILAKSEKRAMICLRLASSASSVRLPSRNTSSNSAGWLSRARCMFSTVICKGKSGFFNSCARRLANSLQAATRSVCTRRWRCSTSSCVMRLKACANCPISSCDVTSTVVFQFPAATWPALSASRRTGRVTRAVAQTAINMPVRMAPAATQAPLRPSEFSSSTNSRRELEISSTASRLSSIPVSGSA